MAKLDSPEFSHTEVSDGFNGGVLTEIVVQDITALQNAWGRPYIQQLIGEAIGSEVQLGGREKAIASREGNSIRTNFIINLIDACISYREVESSEYVLDPEMIFSGLYQWCDVYLHSIFTATYASRGKREYSAYHRMMALFTESHIVYQALVNLGAQRDHETARLGLMIVLKSKITENRPYSDITDFGLITYTFGIWQHDPSEYKAIYRDKGELFYEKVVSMRRQYRVRRAFHDSDSSQIGVLEMLILEGTQVSYADVVRYFFGINEVEERMSIAAIGRRCGTINNSKVKRIVEVGVEFLYENSSSLFPIRLSETDLYSELQAAEARYYEHKAMADHDAWREDYTFRSEYEWHMRVLLSFIQVLERDIRSGDHSASRRYADVSGSEYSYLRGLWNRVQTAFPSCLKDLFEFRENKFGDVICRKFVRILAGISQSEIDPEERIGVYHRAKLIAAEMLFSPQLIVERVDTLLDVLGDSYSRGDKERAAAILGVTSTTINNLCLYLVLETVCSGIYQEGDKESMARVLQISYSELDELVIEDGDVQYFGKLQEATRIILLNLSQAGKSDWGEYGKPGFAISSSIALNIALSNLRSNNRFMFLRAYLYATLCGYNAEEYSRVLTDIGIFQGRMRTLLTQTEMVLLDKPESRRIPKSSRTNSEP